MAETKKETVKETTGKVDFEAEFKTLSSKYEQLEKVCKDYAMQNESLRKALNEVQLDNKARIDYLVDCARHAFISAQIVQANTNNINTVINKGDNV